MKKKLIVVFMCFLLLISLFSFSSCKLSINLKQNTVEKNDTYENKYIISYEQGERILSNLKNLSPANATNDILTTVKDNNISIKDSALKITPIKTYDNWPRVFIAETNDKKNLYVLSENNINENYKLIAIMNTVESAIIPDVSEYSNANLLFTVEKAKSIIKNFLRIKSEKRVSKVYDSTLDNYLKNVELLKTGTKHVKGKIHTNANINNLALFNTQNNSKMLFLSVKTNVNINLTNSDTSWTLPQNIFGKYSNNLSIKKSAEIAYNHFLLVLIPSSSDLVNKKIEILASFSNIDSVKIK